jgi:hypothetical protein
MEPIESEKISAEYLTGFNQGYDMTGQLPELAEHVSKAFGDSERGQGFRDGRGQMLLEQTKERLQDKGRSNERSSVTDRSRDLDIER